MIYYQASDGSIRSMLSDNELYHYGVKGMRWGHRKRIDSVSSTGSRRRSGKTYANANGSRSAYNSTRQAKGESRNSPEARAARVAKAKKALKVGAAVAGTALAAYGTYKLASYMQDKRTQAAVTMAKNYLNDNAFLPDGDFERIGKGPEVLVKLSNRAGDRVDFKAKDRNEAMIKAAQYLDKTRAEADRIYENATNTRLDKGLSKVVNAGNAVGKTTRKASNAARRTADKAKNRVLDVVAPIYEYTPHSTRKKKR